MSSVDGQSVKRLAAIAGMLGSEHEGERANAARLATAELKRLGLSWSDLIQRAFAQVAPPQQRPPPQPFSDGWERPQPYANAHPQQGAGAAADQWAQWARQQGRQYQRPPPRPGRTSSCGGIRLYEFMRMASLHMDRLDSWERSFVHSMLGMGPKVAASDKQWKSIFQIADKLGVAHDVA